MTNRREFLALLGQLLATKADAASPGTAGEWRNRQPGVAYRRLGRTNFMISEVVMGGNTIAPDNYEHVLAALDRGLNYLDTAPAYPGFRSSRPFSALAPENSFCFQRRLRQNWPKQAR
ncbi:MAG TPA: hypothetical protein VFA33_17265 [Bryobacteraceae bacterium]|nr:hypothetical protein [Bryobacteraceae bacterium]